MIDLVIISYDGSIHMIPACRFTLILETRGPVFEHHSFEVVTAPESDDPYRIIVSLHEEESQAAEARDRAWLSISEALRNGSRFAVVSG